MLSVDTVEEIWSSKPSTLHQSSRQTRGFVIVRDQKNTRTSIPLQVAQIRRCLGPLAVSSRRLEGWATCARARSWTPRAYAVSNMARGWYRRIDSYCLCWTLHLSKHKYMFKVFLLVRILNRNPYILLVQVWDRNLVNTESRTLGKHVREVSNMHETPTFRRTAANRLRGGKKWQIKSRFAFSNWAHLHFFFVCNENFKIHLSLAVTCKGRKLETMMHNQEWSTPETNIETHQRKCVQHKRAYPREYQPLEEQCILWVALAERQTVEGKRTLIPTKSRHVYPPETRGKTLIPTKVMSKPFLSHSFLTPTQRPKFGRKRTLIVTGLRLTFRGETNIDFH